MSFQAPPHVNLNDDKSQLAIRSIIACSLLAGFAVLGRFLSRRLVKADLWATDFLIVFGLIGAWALSALNVWDAKLGVGRHIWVVPPQNLTPLLKTYFAEEIFYVVSLLLVKVSILLLYYGLFPGKTFALYVYIVGAFVGAWVIAALMTVIFTCKPIRGFWEPELIPTPECINQRAFFIGNSVLNILADVAILCLPVGKVWHLQMSRRSKIAISCMFMLGGFVVVASILRLVFLLRVNEEDPTWSQYGISVWCCVEVNMAIVSACLPTMRPLLQAMLSTSLFVKLLGSHKPTGFRSDKIPPYKFSKPLRNERGEEFLRLPDHTMGEDNESRAAAPYDIELQAAPMRVQAGKTSAL